MDPDKLLTRQQKATVVEKRIVNAIPIIEGEFKLEYDARYAWHYEVTRGQGGKAKVIFSAKLSSPEFAQIVKRCAEAIAEVRYEATNAIVLRGARGDGE